MWQDEGADWIERAAHELESQPCTFVFGRNKLPAYWVASLEQFVCLN